MNEDDYDKHLYETILQQVIPTRTGLAYLQSTVPVWMSAVNSSAPTRRELVYRKDWTGGDSFLDYKKGGSKYYDASKLFKEEDTRKSEL